MNNFIEFFQVVDSFDVDCAYFLGVSVHCCMGEVVVSFSVISGGGF